ncbi:hypothetical protein [Burkholderia mallei]|uniref:hypothetical protein n=1 Tax=Burkholderia mallei TaxID=13373 RepID=UPI00139667D4|nr:hypothetical protein [Burkholderia mallei]
MARAVYSHLRAALADALADDGAGALAARVRGGRCGLRDCDILLRVPCGARRASAAAAPERGFDGSARARRYNRDLAAVAPHHGRPARVVRNFDAAMMRRSGR